MSKGDSTRRADALTEREEVVPEPRSEPTLVEILLAEQAKSPPPLAPRIDGIVLGRIAAVESAGAALVTFAGVPLPGLGARAMVPLADDVGQDVALMFEGGDPRRPVVLGRMVSPLANAQTEAAVDGRRVEIHAEEELVLRCGESSITLTRARKIILRGDYLLSRASGVNRIEGGSVEIN